MEEAVLHFLLLLSYSRDPTAAVRRDCMALGDFTVHSATGYHVPALW